MIEIDHSMKKGWLRKECRFGLMHNLKLRYFVLSDTELRYYKHPEDIHPAGMIQLDKFCKIHIDNNNTSHHLYGFKLTTTNQSKSHWIPMLYLTNKEDREYWVNEIQRKIEQLDYIKHPYIAESKEMDDPQYNVLDKWLHKLDLYDENDNYMIENSSSSLYSCLNNNNHSSSSGSNTFSFVSTFKNKSLDSSIIPIYYSESTMTNSHNRHSSHHRQSPPPPLPSRRASVLPNTNNMVSLESEQKKYIETTSSHYYYQHRLK